MMNDMNDAKVLDAVIAGTTSKLRDVAVVWRSKCYRYVLVKHVGGYDSYGVLKQWQPPWVTLYDVIKIYSHGSGMKAWDVGREAGLFHGKRQAEIIAWAETAIDMHARWEQLRQAREEGTR